MKNVDELIDSAAELSGQGRSTGEIADELNVSRETARWLVSRADDGHTATAGNNAGDIHVDWSAIGEDSDRLDLVSRALADLLIDAHDPVPLTVGIEKAGVPLATAVSRELDTDLATYAPRKHRMEASDNEVGGTFSRNFAGVEDRDCFVIDDTITSGTTMTETVQSIREAGGNPVACAVIADKRGLKTAEDVPVHAMIEVISVDAQE